jgi:hypothetical protein
MGHVRQGAWNYENKWAGKTVEIELICGDGPTSEALDRIREEEAVPDGCGYVVFDPSQTAVVQSPEEFP